MYEVREGVGRRPLSVEVVHVPPPRAMSKEEQAAALDAWARAYVALLLRPHGWEVTPSGPTRERRA
jgi:hypothetical protein